MQISSRNHSVLRPAVLAVIVAAIVGASWWVAAGRNEGLSLDLDPFLVDGSSRANVSTDRHIDNLQERLRANPDDWQSYSQLGLAYLQKARETGDPTYYQRAEEALDEALAREPGDYASISARGALALARHDFAAALEWGENARRINPDRTYAYGVIADAQVELGRYEDAIETLQAMVDLRPDMSSYSRISYLREMYGDIEGAIELMELAAQSGTAGAEGTAWVRTQLATLYFNSGDLASAEREYLQTLRNRPDYVYALAGLGRVRAAEGDMDAAIELLSRAVSLMPLPEFVISLGDLYQVSGQQAAADQQYQLVAAIEKLHRANGVDMDMEIALFNADHDRNMTETVALARRAYSNRPGIHGADALAWALYKSGSYEEARTYSLEALRLGTKDSLKLFHAGMIALRLGDREQAREYLEQALALNPHFSILHAEEARTALDALP